MVILIPWLRHWVTFWLIFIFEFQKLCVFFSFSNHDFVQECIKQFSLLFRFVFFDLEQEILTLRKECRDFDLIISYLGWVYIDDQYFAIITEPTTSVTLRQILRNSGEMRPKEKLNIMYHTAVALKYLHEIGVHTSAVFLS